jgi:exopolyphosphatase/guanosine-5'-triphosphate,3'-diphosphate pyrophosphatase
VARYHRGSPPKKKHDQYRELSPTDQRRVASLAAILRLALALDRTHQQHVEDVRARVRNDHVQITVESHGDADVDVWAAERKVELFEKVFGRKVRFSARNGNARENAKRSRSAKNSNRSRPANGLPR